MVLTIDKLRLVEDARFQLSPAPGDWTLVLSQPRDQDAGECGSHFARSLSWTEFAPADRPTTNNNANANTNRRRRPRKASTSVKCPRWSQS